VRSIGVSPSSLIVSTTPTKYCTETPAPPLMVVRAFSGRHEPCPGPPEEYFERNESTSVEADPLLLQPRALDVAVRTVRTLGDAAPGVDDAMPREAGPRGQRRERVADDARLSRQVGEAGDLTVRRDLAARDARHDRIDAPEGAVRSRQGSRDGVAFDGGNFGGGRSALSASALPLLRGAARARCGLRRLRGTLRRGLLRRRGGPHGGRPRVPRLIDPELATSR